MLYSRLFYSSHFNHFNTSREIRRFCEFNSCPDDMHQVNPTTCCVHHTGVHVCSPSGFSCGSTQVVVHSWGNILHIFTASITIYDAGRHILFVVAKIDDLHLYRYQEINVITSSECGDGFCHSTESCDECKTDCCPFQLHHLLLVIIGSVIILVSLSIVTLIAMCYYYNKYKKLYYDLSWIVDCSEIKNASYSTVCASYFETFCNQSGHANKKDLQLFTSTGVYKKQDVAIKYVHKNTFNVNSVIKNEIYQIRLLDHPNLCKFVGASVEAPKIAILMEYCPKGSLYDVLQNKEIHFSWGFRFSFADDIAAGMAYLHSKGILHGRLKSSNCLINDKWVLKITDYGLATLRRTYGVSEDPVKLARDKACKVYLAPEIVSTVDALPTGPADVFSYSMILFEIATRISPYSSIITEVTTLHGLDKNCPCPIEYSELVKRCYDEVPSKRPTFVMIKKQLQKINPNHESPIDNMILMIQKYTSQLELMVTERTQEIVSEKERSDQLLNNLLPPNVAVELKMGCTTTARSFDCVTIFFSDIIGFTRLASQSTPMEVVNMLNELYTMFDNTLDRFDVYKVETIGDAYMVVSGVPYENGINHASEIACMALDLLSAVHDFTIPHRQSEKLRIRIGIHCGPVVAGIVGTKMPRYCLFGDTVNIASRMEKDSEAMRIHISNTYAQLLLKIGGFNLQRRCWTSKSFESGSATKCTWWLNHVTLNKWAFRLHKHSAASMP